jgi:hypothetical protein
MTEWMIAAATVVPSAFGVAFALNEVALKPRRRRHAFEKAQGSIESFARRMGLTYQPDRELDEIGTIRGPLQGHEILMRVFPEIDIRVGWSGGKEYALDIQTREPHQRPGDGMLEFTASAFAKLYRQRYAGAGLAKVFEGERALQEVLISFAKSPKYRIESIRIGKYGITCTLETEGAGGYDEVQASELLADMLPLVREVETKLAGLETKDDWDAW